MMPISLQLGALVIALLTFTDVWAQTDPNAETDPIVVWCTEKNYGIPSSIAGCIEASRKQGPETAKALAEDLERGKQARDQKQQRMTMVRSKIQQDVARGYAYMTIKNYAQNASNLPSRV